MPDTIVSHGGFTEEPGPFAETLHAVLSTAPVVSFRGAPTENLQKS